MIQRLAKYFAGWLGWGVLNGLLMASTGHLVNDPAIAVRRSVALAMSALCIVTVLACQRFTDRYKLHVVEKPALLNWLVAFTVAANAERFGIPALDHRYASAILRVVVAPFQTKTPPSCPTARNGN